MRTLIVLCAGTRRINNLPIFLNRHPDGKLLAEKAIEGIYPDKYDEIVYTILQADDDRFAAERILLNEVGRKYNVKVIKLCMPTNGPAESVYLTIKTGQIEGEFAVRDSLNNITLCNHISGNFVAGLDLIKYDDEVYNVRSKSFMVTNEQGQILDIIEKRLRSDIISVGLYGFKKAADFIFAYEKLNDINYPIKKMHVSNIISYLIGYKQRVFHCTNVSFHEDWGTPETWNRMQRKYATVFVDTDKLLGKYYEDKWADELVNKLSLLEGTAQSIVLFTRSNAVNKKSIYDKLDKKRIKCIDFVCSVSYSSEQLMVSGEHDLEKVKLGI